MHDAPMPDRRTFLGTLTVLAAVGLSGCSGDDGTTNESPPDAADGDPGGDTNDGDEASDSTNGSRSEGETSSGEPDFEISADLPDEIAVEEELTYSYTVENTGTAAGEVDLTVSVTDSAGERQTPIERTLSLGPGESDTKERTNSFTEQGRLTWEYAVEWEGGRDSTTEVLTVTPPTLRYGESYRTDHDIVITISNLRDRDYYLYTDDSGETATQEAPPGKQFGFVDVAVANEADEPRTTPAPSTFEMAAVTERVEPALETYERDDSYTGNREVESGSEDTGVLPFIIPNGVGTNYLEVFANGSDEDYGASWELRWVAER